MTQKVFVIKNKQLSDDLYSPNSTTPSSKTIGEIFSLPHTVQPEVIVQYLFLNNEIFEIQKVKHREDDVYPSTWFISESVESDGSLYICTPIDLMFLAIPYFLKAKSVAGNSMLELYYILSSKETGVPHTDYILEAYQALDVETRQRKLSLFCNTMMGDGEYVYKLNDDKLLEYLKVKFARVCVSIIHTPSVVPLGISRAASLPTLADFQRSRASSSDFTFVYQLALGLLGDHLCDEVFNRFCTLYSDDNGTPFDAVEVKRVKIKSNFITDDTEVKEVAGKRAAPALDKSSVKKSKTAVAPGKNNILSFFGKKK